MHGTRKQLLIAALAGLLAAMGCSKDDGSGGDEDKKDDPGNVANSVCDAAARQACADTDDPASCAEKAFTACRDEVAVASHCAARREDALQCGQSEGNFSHSFVGGALRWGVQDVGCVTHGSEAPGLKCNVPNVDQLASDIGAEKSADERGRTRAENNEGRFRNDDGSFKSASPFDPTGDATKPDSRGQEYTEYYAVLQLPRFKTEDGELVLNDDEEAVIEESLPTAALGQLLPDGFNTTEHNVFKALGASNAQRDAVIEGLDLFEDEFPDQASDQAMGACVFYSWHGDIQQPLEICSEEGSCPNLPAGPKAAAHIGTEYDLPMTAKNFRMKISINSNFAAVDLVDKCGTTPAQMVDLQEKGDIEELKKRELSRSPARISPAIEDTFERGCARTYELFTTEWRRSDPTICTAPMRLEECGCALRITAGPEGEEQSFDVPPGLRVDFQGRSITALSRLLVTDPGVDQDGFFGQLAAAVQSIDDEDDKTDFDHVVTALKSLSAQGATDKRFFLRGFVLGDWNDTKNTTARVGEVFETGGYFVPADKCAQAGGRPTVEGRCEVDTWGSKFATEALSAPDGCRYVPIAKKGCAFAEDGDTDCSNINGGLGEHGRNLLVCDIPMSLKKVAAVTGTAENFFADPKLYCQRLFADKIAVHIPYQASHIPDAELVCNPPAGMEAECGFAQRNPAQVVAVRDDQEDTCQLDPDDRVIVRDPLPPELDEREKSCSVVCVKGKACGGGCLAKTKTCAPDKQMCSGPDCACDAEDGIAPIVANPKDKPTVRLDKESRAKL